MTPKAEVDRAPCRVGACADLACDIPRSAQAPTLQKAGGSAWTLWLWVAGGFLFVAILWTAMFTAARQADTRTVPLEAKGGR